MVNIDNIQISKDTLFYFLNKINSPIFIVKSNPNNILKLIKNNSKVEILNYKTEEKIEISNELLFNFLNLDYSDKIFSLSGISIYLNKLDRVLTNFNIKSITK